MFDAVIQIGGISLSYLESALLGLFILAWVIHVFYALRYFLPATKVKSFNPENQQGVSVIVCARNEEENLRELIPAIMEQNFPEFQLIVVNDSSWDETADILKALQLEYPAMHVIHIDGVQLHILQVEFGIMMAPMQPVVILRHS